MTETYTMDDIGGTTYTDADRAGERPSLKTDLNFEGRIASFRVRVAKGGYLQVNARIEALDGKGKVMNSAFTQAALPVSFRGKAPGSWAKGLFARIVYAVLPEVAPYDSVSTDAITKKKIYSKAGNVLDGAAFKRSDGEATKACEEIAKELAKFFVENGDKADYTPFMDKSVFFSLEEKAGFINVVNLSAQNPGNICYNRNEAVEG